jgi:hypothetical protein
MSGFNGSPFFVGDTEPGHVIQGKLDKPVCRKMDRQFQPVPVKPDRFFPSATVENRIGVFNHLIPL